MVDGHAVLLKAEIAFPQIAMVTIEKENPLAGTSVGQDTSDHDLNSQRSPRGHLSALKIPVRRKLERDEFFPIVEVYGCLFGA